MDPAENTNENQKDHSPPGVDITPSKPPQRKPPSTINTLLSQLHKKTQQVSQLSKQASDQSLLEELNQCKCETEILKNQIKALEQETSTQKLETTKLMNECEALKKERIQLLQGNGGLEFLLEENASRIKDANADIAHWRANAEENEQKVEDITRTVGRFLTDSLGGAPQ